MAFMQPHSPRSGASCLNWFKTAYVDRKKKKKQRKLFQQPYKYTNQPAYLNGGEVLHGIAIVLWQSASYLLVVEEIRGVPRGRPLRQM